MSRNGIPDFGEALAVGRKLDLKLPDSGAVATPTPRHRLNRQLGFSTM